MSLEHIREGSEPGQLEKAEFLSDVSLGEDLSDSLESEGLRPSGLFLDTINRKRLDFDFEKVCSVSLSNINVYACLVCGKYYRGRGKTSYAYTHSLHEDHHVFINLHTLKVYILPDNYEEKDASLNDIKNVLNPVFSQEEISNLDKVEIEAYDLNKKQYIPGSVGLNNLKANDYMNVVFQALVHVKPIRNHFLADTSNTGSELVKAFGALTRRMWNSKAFKGQVSPHELLQVVFNASKKRFKLTKKSDPIDLLTWLLNSLHLGMSKCSNKNLIFDTFGGELIVESLESKEHFKIGLLDEIKNVSRKRTQFLFLGLDLPPPPLLKNDAEKNIIPQVPISNILEKYDGVHLKEYGYSLKRFLLTKLPKYLIFHIKRFTKTNWGIEKNPTIVNFPIKNLDMSPYINSNCASKYNLVANICHEGSSEKEGNVYKIHVHNKATDRWYQIQDLIVEEIIPQMVILSESYIQIWENTS